VKIINGKPPNFKKIHAAFPLASRPGTIFTYGDTVYVIGAHDISPCLKAHEATHIEQQKKLGPEVWWERYIEDPAFRFEQELPAHRAEYRTFKAMERDRNRVSHALYTIADRLAGPLYGGLLTSQQARQKILA
jgi:hypothetical protein